MNENMNSTSDMAHQDERYTVRSDEQPSTLESISTLKSGEGQFHTQDYIDFTNKTLQTQAAVNLTNIRKELDCLYTDIQEQVEDQLTQIEKSNTIIQSLISNLNKQLQASKEG